MKRRPGTSIVVERSSELFMMGATFEINIDGTDMRALGLGDRVRIYLPEGDHVICVRYDSLFFSFKTERIHFHLESGEMRIFKCESIFNGFGLAISNIYPLDHQGGFRLHEVEA